MVGIEGRVVAIDYLSPLVALSLENLRKEDADLLDSVLLWIHGISRDVLVILVELGRKKGLAVAQPCAVWVVVCLENLRRHPSSWTGRWMERLWAGLLGGFCCYVSEIVSKRHEECSQTMLVSILCPDYATFVAGLTHAPSRSQKQPSSTTHHVVMFAFLSSTWCTLWFSHSLPPWPPLLSMTIWTRFGAGLALWFHSRRSSSRVPLPWICSCPIGLVMSCRISWTWGGQDIHDIPECDVPSNMCFASLTGVSTSLLQACISY